MGDAAGDLADRVHLLRVGELGLRALLLGDVGGDPADATTVGRVQDRKLDGQQGAIPGGSRPDDFPLDRLPAFDHLPVVGGQESGELGRNELSQGLAEHGGRRPAEEALERAVDENMAAVEIPDADRQRRVVHDSLEARLVGAQRGIGVVPLRDRRGERFGLCREPAVGLGTGADLPIDPHARQQQQKAHQAHDAACDHHLAPPLGKHVALG